MIRIPCRKNGAQGVPTEVVLAHTVEQALAYMLTAKLEYMPDMERYYNGYEWPALQEHFA